MALEWFHIPMKEWQLILNHFNLEKGIKACLASLFLFRRHVSLCLPLSSGHIVAIHVIFTLQYLKYVYTPRILGAKQVE